MLPVLLGPARGHPIRLADGPRNFLPHVFGGYERDVVQFLQRELRTVRVFADIGAGDGYYTRVALAALPAAGVVVAFEPRRRLDLLALAERNSGRVVLREEAISDKDTEGSFAFGPEYGYATAREGLPIHEGYDVRTIMFRSLDSLIAEGSIPRPDVLEIDVEGFEVVALTGMRDLLTSSHPTLAVECHTLTLLRDVLTVLCDVGYQNATVSRDRAGSGPWQILVRERLGLNE